MKEWKNLCVFLLRGHSETQMAEVTFPALLGGSQQTQE